MNNKQKNKVVLVGIIVCALAIGIGIGLTIPRASNVEENQMIKEDDMYKSLNTSSPLYIEEYKVADFEAIEIGTKKEKIHERFKEPVGTLSGLFGDIYMAEGKHIIIYYDFDIEGGHPVKEIKVAETKKSAETKDVKTEKIENPTVADFEAIEIGTKMEKVHELFDEPAGTLSGLLGDIYVVEDKRIIIYYGFEDGYPVSEIKVSEIKATKSNAKE